MKLLHFLISFFFTVFNEKITGRRQFNSNDQILRKHVKNWENMDFYMGFMIGFLYGLVGIRIYTDF